MPSEQESEVSKADKQLCAHLGLGQKPSLYNSIKKTLHDMAVQHLDLLHPMYLQQANMHAFVQRVMEAFPGHFNLNNKERVESLQLYIGSYLDQKRHEISAGKKKKSSSGPCTTYSVLPDGDTIKIARRQPSRSASRSRKKASSVSYDDSMDLAPTRRSRSTSRSRKKPLRFSDDDAMDVASPRSSRFTSRSRKDASRVVYDDPTDLTPSKASLRSRKQTPFPRGDDLMDAAPIYPDNTPPPSSPGSSSESSLSPFDTEMDVVDESPRPRLRRATFVIESPPPSPPPHPLPEHSPQPVVADHFDEHVLFVDQAPPHPVPELAPPQTDHYDGRAAVVDQPPPPQPSPDSSPEPSVPNVAIDPIVDFLDGCNPQMVRCAPAFHQAGATETEHLIGIARWDDTVIREFLKNNEIARTPLEEQAIVIGLKCLLRDLSRLYA
ncbi:hypothetical protein C8R43DRAFT_309572 [Mycena crocata]|nr:hypothetical protein C8R43DRAFT_309572 [Mycena crocata]